VLLVLFDIDGTLLSGATDAHLDALHAALRTVHGVDATKLGKLVEPAGRTDGDIARTILLDAGVSAQRIDERAEAVREECCRVYAQLCTEDLRRSVLPGVQERLEWLTRRGGVIVGLLTGNYEPVARLKLTRAQLGRYFPPRQGAFGSDSDDRSMLPAIARRRAGTRGHPHPREQTLVIGDTPRDIACARADGVRCVAVATGPYAVDQLQDADRVAADAAQLRLVLERVLDA